MVVVEMMMLLCHKKPTFVAIIVFCYWPASVLLARITKSSAQIALSFSEKSVKTKKTLTKKANNRRNV